MPPVDTAVILAAGLGSRLREVWADRPKGFVEIGGETLVARSLRALKERGVVRTVIVAGYHAEEYHALAATYPGVEVAENRAFAETGSMASLDVALAVVPGDFLLLESDLFYDPRGLDAVFAYPGADVVLASGPTGAGDEVWIDCRDGRIAGLSKDRAQLRSADGELVGIVRVSAALGALMRERFAAFVARTGHGRMSYDTEALHALAAERSLAMCLVPDLLWGEIDMESHYRRVREQVFPAWSARQEARRV